MSVPWWEEHEPPSGRAAHGGVTSPTKPAWRPTATRAPVPEPADCLPIAAVSAESSARGAAKPSTRKSDVAGGHTQTVSVGGGEVTPRGGSGGGHGAAAEASAAIRLTPARNQTVTILILRHQKHPPHRLATAEERRDAVDARKPPPPPVPVPITFKRRVDEPHGELALAELLPLMQVGWLAYNRVYTFCMNVSYLFFFNRVFLFFLCAALASLDSARPSPFDDDKSCIINNE